MILENMKDEIYKKKKKTPTAYNRSATSFLVKHSTKQGIWKAANIFPGINRDFSSIFK